MSEKFWKFQNAAGGGAELLLYGDISQTSWWGDEVTPKQFAEELAALGDVSEITVRINSGGGDVFAAQTIGNLLEDHKAFVTAKLDGLCASAATVVACHCNKVVAANDNTYMVHPVKVGISGYLEAKQLEVWVEAIKTIRETILDLYVRKTGRDKDEVAGWMDNTSWWTAQQAMENGFVDELADGTRPVTVEDRGGVLFVNSVGMGLPFDKVPEFVRKRVAAKAADLFANKTPTTPPGKAERKDQTMDEIKTVDDLRRAYPGLVDQIEREAAETATAAERERIQDIEEMSIAGSEELAREAKFQKPVSAADFAKAAMKRAAAKGSAYMKDAKDDAVNSGVNDLGQEPPAAGGGKDEFMDAIKGLGVQEK